MATDYPLKSLEERIADLHVKRDRVSRAIDGLDPIADPIRYARAVSLLCTIDGKIASLEKLLAEQGKGVEDKLRHIEEALDTFWETVEKLA
jgi:hypothetical protein